jgi:hypothetical protein
MWGGGGGLWVPTSGLGGLATIVLGTGSGLVGQGNLGGRFGGALGAVGLSFEFFHPHFGFAV